LPFSYLISVVFPNPNPTSRPTPCPPSLSILTKHTQGGEKYQSAFYVFEELATNTSTTSPHSLVAQAVSELHLGRLPEAEAALQQAITQNSNSADTLANLVVLNTLLGKKDEAAKLKSQLQGVDKEHRLLSEWAEKRSEFEKAKAKYTPKFEV
jgi:coatomer protein complex subunit epsilon